MAKELKDYKYTVHVICKNCGWDTQKVQRAMIVKDGRRQFSVRIPMGTTTKEFLKTHRCMLCQCEGTCKSKGWTHLQDS